MDIWMGGVGEADEESFSLAIPLIKGSVASERRVIVRKAQFVYAVYLLFLADDRRRVLTIFRVRWPHCARYRSQVFRGQRPCSRYRGKKKNKVGVGENIAFENRAVYVIRSIAGAARSLRVFS